jgi:mannonate dehydratase
MARITRRRLLYLAGGGTLALIGMRFALPRLFRPGRRSALGSEAARLVRECFTGIDRARLWDVHVHAIGLGAGGTGCWINPEMQSHLHPVERLQFDLYRAAVGMDNERTADADYFARLLDLHGSTNPQGKLLLMAFDWNVGEDGDPRPELSTIHTPNEYVLRLAAGHACVEACVSIHPYRPDALEQLDRAVEGGARAVKWLPNAMGIDPSSSRCDAFYRRLAISNLPLITHAGKEYAVGAEGQQRGNPLLLRRALDEGVRVVVAHCGALGSFPDLDVGGRREAESLDLFLRLLGERDYDDTLFGDISAIAQINYGARPLRELLAAPELHGRLLYGSDYPMPAIRFLNSPRWLEQHGLLGSRERRLCSKIFEFNPLLFDFVVKRSLRVELEGRTYRFLPRVFDTARLFEGVSPGREPSPAAA